METKAIESQIKDIKLADWGRKEIELAEVEMPGLMNCRKEFGKNKPFAGARITGSLHMTIQTAILIETLKELGADIRWASCNIYSTQDEAAAAVVANKAAVVFAWKGETVAEYWKCTLNALSFPDNKGPNLIVDDGGDATMMLLEGRKWEIAYEKNKELPDLKKYEDEAEDIYELFKMLREIIPQNPTRFRDMLKDFYGCSEETTTGVHRLYQLAERGELYFPAMNVNDSITKSKFDNIYGCRHSLIDGINRATDVMISGKKVLVCGYGDVGKGCAQAMKSVGARVDVTEVDPICALQACMEGFKVSKIESVLEKTDIFVTATGNKKIITAEHMSKMKNNAIVCNIGHFDNEIDTQGLKKYPGIKSVEIKPQVDRYIFPDGHAIILLAGGRLVNLGCATGHPSFVMSNSFSNQVLAQLELWNNRSNGKYKNQVYKLPKELDEKVARLHLDALDAELTVMNKDQSDYISVPVEGPYKKNDYHY